MGLFHAPMRIASKKRDCPEDVSYHKNDPSVPSKVLEWNIPRFPALHWKSSNMKKNTLEVI